MSIQEYNFFDPKQTDIANKEVNKTLEKYNANMGAFKVSSANLSLPKLKELENNLLQNAMDSQHLFKKLEESKYDGNMSEIKSALEGLKTKLKSISSHEKCAARIVDIDIGIHQLKDEFADIMTRNNLSDLEQLTKKINNITIKVIKILDGIEKDKELKNLIDIDLCLSRLNKLAELADLLNTSKTDLQSPDKITSEKVQKTTTEQKFNKIVSKPIKIGNALFNYSNTNDIYKKNSDNDEDFNKLDNKILDVVNSTSKEIQKTHHVKSTDIKRIEINKSHITYYINTPNYTKVSYKISKDLGNKIAQLPQHLLQLQRDIVGEKILEVSKKVQFTNLYLYSSGGGGHKSAKEAAMERDFKNLLNYVKVALEGDRVLNVDVDINSQELEKVSHLLNDERLKDPVKLSEWCKQMGLVKDIDVLHDFLGNVGMWASSQWDKAQQEGDVAKQESLASKQWLSDLFFGPVVFISILLSLIDFKPKQIISTQAMATPSILSAIKLYNTNYKPKEDQDVKLQLYMTDLPTEYAQHFFNSLKGITEEEEKKFLVLHAPKLEEKTNWESLCGLPKEQVKELDVHELPVRLDFLKAVEEYKPNLEHPRVEIKVSDPQELKLLHEVMQHQSGQVSNLGDAQAQGVQFLNYPIKPKDKGTFIMLGSQPTKSAIEGYVQEYLKLAKKNSNTNYHVFTFAGKFEKDKDCFYKELSAYIKNQPNWPANLRFIPLSYQTPKQLVSLEMTCDTITRSGGATAMELLVLNEVNHKYPGLPRRQRFIHAQPIEGRTLEESIPLWERGNYLFLKKKMNAKVIDPNTFKTAMQASHSV